MGVRATELLEIPRSLRTRIVALIAWHGDHENDLTDKLHHANVDLSHCIVSLQAIMAEAKSPAAEAKRCLQTIRKAVGCPICEGAKTLSSLGGREVECKGCDGEGWI